MHRAIQSVLLLGVIAAALTLAGCASTIDTQKAESVLKTKVVDQTGVDVSSVTCPDDIAAKKGDVFYCTINGADGTAAPIKVTQTDDSGNINYNADLVQVNSVESQISDYLLAKVGADYSKVDCPDVIEYQVGKQFDCEASGGGTPNESVTVTLQEHGTFDLSSGVLSPGEAQ